MRRSIGPDTAGGAPIMQLVVTGQGRRHNRRDGYYRYYEKARKTAVPFMMNAIRELLYEHPHPRRRMSPRGRNKEHSWEKLDFACIYMAADNDTYRTARDHLMSVRHVWNEPLPTHKEIVSHMQTIDTEWLDFLLARTAFLCLDELAECNATAPLGADSSGIETTRYEYADVPNMTLDEFVPEGARVQMRTKKFLKYHITAVLGHQIVLTAITTPGNVHDSTVLPAMLANIKKFGFDFSGRYVNGDRGYDSEDNCRLVFSMDMAPNIRQRQYRSMRDDPPGSVDTYRKLAAKMFNPSVYKHRAHIEAIFGAEETRRHQLHCRFVLDENRSRFSKLRGITWNINVLHRFMCARELGIPIPSYDGSKHARKEDGSRQTRLG